MLGYRIYLYTYWAVFSLLLLQQNINSVKIRNVGSNQMQAQESLNFLGNQDPMMSLIWENLLEDLSNAHDRLDSHEEHWDTWRHDFEVSMNQVSTWMFSTVNDLRHTIETQQQQIDELLMLTNG